MNYDVVTFTNTTGEDFEGKYAGEPYTIKAGESKPYPRFLAEHFAKHLVDRIIMLDNPQQLNDKKLRAELASEMLGETVVKAESTQEMSEGERVKKEVEGLEKGAHRKEKVEPFAELKGDENVPEEIVKRDKMRKEVLEKMDWRELQKKGSEAGVYKGKMGKDALVAALLDL